MTDANKPVGKVTSLTSPIEKIIFAYREAERAALLAEERLDVSVKSGADAETLSDLKQHVSDADRALVEAIHAVSAYQAKTLADVRRKLNLWYDMIAMEGTEEGALSPVENLVLSAFSDIDELVKSS